MGRRISNDKDDKSSEKQTTNDSDSDSDSNLDEEEFVVEKILKMRTTKKGKVQCKSTIFAVTIYGENSCYFCFLKIYSNGKDFLIVKTPG